MIRKRLIALVAGLALATSGMAQASVSNFALLDASHVAVTYSDGRVAIASPTDVVIGPHGFVGFADGAIVTTLSVSNKLVARWKELDGTEHEVITDCMTKTYQDCLIEHAKLVQLTKQAFPPAPRAASSEPGR